MKYILFLYLLFFVCFSQTNAQTPNRESFSRHDSLRGALTPLRSAYDVIFYDLNLRVNPSERSIKGYNTIHYKTITGFDKIQVDLFSNMKITRIAHQGKDLAFERDSNAFFVNFPQRQAQGIVDSITVFYEGKPIVALNPPWDGGFTWKTDKTGKPWIGVSCEGIGASLWWPNKDHLSDEPDSMNITLEVPSNLMAVANGNLRETKKLEDNYTRYYWHVSYPINNYNVTVNVADYAHFSDTYTAADGEKLGLDYYVLQYNLDKAKKHFEQVKPMLACYEKYFGKYPFWKDGYALVETPYLGMEHQSAIAYGNDYMPGYRGHDLSETGVGLKFDYLIIHESGHEYWGNSVSTQDHAEMWIHESFCTYSEALYVECMMGYDKALLYLGGIKNGVRNKEPIIGPLGVNYQGWEDTDMYFKGALVLHTLRNVINDDKLWFDLVYGIAQEFKIKTTNTNEIIKFINQKIGKDYTYFFDQYLRHASIPTFAYNLQQKGKKLVLNYKWEADVPGFNMPLKVGFPNKDYQVIHPTTEWQSITLKGKEKDFKIAKELFYINTEWIKK